MATNALIARHDIFPGNVTPPHPTAAMTLGKSRSIFVVKEMATQGN